MVLSLLQKSPPLSLQLIHYPTVTKLNILHHNSCFQAKIANESYETSLSVLEIQKHNYKIIMQNFMWKEHPFPVREIGAGQPQIGFVPGATL